MNKAERDRARIAELRRQARIAQGRDPDQDDRPADSPGPRWEPDAGAGARFVQVGPGLPVLTPDEAARRLHWPARKVEAMAAAGELESVLVGGWTRMVPLAEVERIERANSADG